MGVDHHFHTHYTKRHQGVNGFFKWTAIQTLGALPGRVWQEQGARRAGRRCRIGGPGEKRVSRIAGMWRNAAVKNASKGAWQSITGMRGQGCVISTARKGGDASATGRLEAESSGSRLWRANGEPDVMSKQPRSALWWSGILQQMINVALELFHLGQELGPRNFFQFQQEHGELCQR